MVVIYICDDNMLMEQTKNGDTKAFEQLVLRHREKAIGFAFSFLTDAYMAEDIVQESFAAIYINRHRYKAKNTFKTFLFAVVRNKCIDFIRKNKDSNIVSLEDVNLVSTEPTLYDLIEQQERLKYSAKLLNSLKADYRTAFCLYEIYGFSYKEIAEIMDKSLPQIKIILYRARNKLQKYAEEDMQNEK